MIVIWLRDMSYGLRVVANPYQFEERLATAKRNGAMIRIEHDRSALHITRDEWIDPLMVTRFYAVSEDEIPDGQE